MEPPQAVHEECDRSDALCGVWPLSGSCGLIDLSMIERSQGWSELDASLRDARSTNLENDHELGGQGTASLRSSVVKSYKVGRSKGSGTMPQIAAAAGQRRCGQHRLPQVPSVRWLTAHMEALRAAVQRTPPVLIGSRLHCSSRLAVAVVQQPCAEKPTGFIESSIATLPAAVQKPWLHVAAQQLSGHQTPASNVSCKTQHLESILGLLQLISWVERNLQASLRAVRTKSPLRMLLW